MDFKKFVRPKIKGKYCSLETLAKLLNTSPENLLDAACEGALEVFVQRPDGVRIYSVHADALDVEDAQLLQDKFLRRVRSPDPAESKPIEVHPLNPEECLPLGMSDYAIEGLKLTRSDCQSIKEKEKYRQIMFASGVKTTYHGIVEVEPTKGQFHFKYQGRQTLREDGWRLACYGLSQEIKFHEGIGYSRPQGVDLELDKLMVTSDDIDRYVNTLDPRFQLGEFIIDGRIVIEKLPSYISRKLIYLIEANEAYWGGGVPADIKEAMALQEQARLHLMKRQFQELFEATKGKIPTGQSLFCKKCITPALARNPLPEWSSGWPEHLTPELLIMLYVSIRTWGQPRVRLDDVSSHPLTDDIVDLFRKLGFTGDDAKSAPTIIRPEGAGKGRPVPPAEPLKPLIGRMGVAKRKQT